MQFTVEEENLICMYHKSDRRRTAANIRAALPDMDEDMAALARQTADKLDAMNDADFETRQFHPLRPALFSYACPIGKCGSSSSSFKIKCCFISSSTASSSIMGV